jgi:hypothetical protein
MGIEAPYVRVQESLVKDFQRAVDASEEAIRAMVLKMAEERWQWPLPENTSNMDMADACRENGGNELYWLAAQALDAIDTVKLAMRFGSS